MPDDELQQSIDGSREADRRLQRTIADLTDEQARRPSRLPDWSVGHVLTHVARNADSVVRRLDASARGEVVDQYAGGFAGRAAEIDAGAGRPAASLRDDVEATSAAVEAAIAAMPADSWGNLSRSVGGDLQPAEAVVFSRWREVEVHHVDLGLGYDPGDWPPDLVVRWLPEIAAGLARRAEPAALLAWGLGRGPAPELGSWP